MPKAVQTLGNLAPTPEAPLSVSAMSGSRGSASCRDGDTARSAPRGATTVTTAMAISRREAAGPAPCRARSIDQSEQRREKHRERPPEDEGGRAGPAGDRDREEPEIGDEDGQRAERPGSRRGGPSVVRRRVCARAARRAQSVAGAASGGGEGRGHDTSIRGFCRSARMSKKRQRRSATAMPMTTSTSASAAP